MVLYNILRLYDQVKPKLIIKGTSGQPFFTDGDVLLVPFFLAARQRKIIETYDCFTLLQPIHQFSNRL